MSALKNFRLISYGFLLGTAGIAVLGSRDAKKIYTEVTAAAKRCGGCVMKKAEEIRESCEDISAEADAINEKRAEEERAREIEDANAVLAAAEERNTKAGEAEKADDAE